MKSNRYSCYRNGPYYNGFRFLLELIKFWKWNRMKFIWIIWSVKHFFTVHFKKFKYPKMEFDYFMSKFIKRTEWFKEYRYDKK